MTAPRRPHEQGSATLEVAIVTPALLLFMLLVVFGGRLALAHGEADSAARDAARAASIARSPGAATGDARQAAAATLTNAGISCRGFAVATDTSGFQPGGAVTVEVACTAALSDLGLLGVPGSQTLHGRYTAPVDRFRGVLQ
jgi:Flp pilus assembly protein TadG